MFPMCGQNERSENIDTAIDIGAILDETMLQKIGKDPTKRVEKKATALIINATKWNEEIPKALIPRSSCPQRLYALCTQ